MKTVKSTIAIAILVFATVATAGGKDHGYKKHRLVSQQQRFEYARVVDVEPIYREVEVSSPVRECWDEPVYSTRNNAPKSAAGILAGGLIGGIVGHQFGKGRGNKVATAIGAVVGAHIGHQAVNGHVDQAQSQVVEYREHCRVSQQVSYEEVLDGYDVTYKYRGQRYQIDMPYHPGKRIKMRIQFSPVI